MQFEWVFLLIMKGNDYYNIHRKFQVHSTSILGLGAKTKIRKWQPPPSIPNFDSLPYSYPKVGCQFFFFFSAEVTALMIQLPVRAGPRICKKRGPSVKIEGKLADMAPK